MTAKCAAIRRMRGAVLSALLLAFILPAHAGRFGDGGPQGDPFAEGERARRMEEMRVRRAEREMLRERQREGLAPAAGAFEPGGDAHAVRQMGPEERRRFRRELNDAARELYRDQR